MRELGLEASTFMVDEGADGKVEVEAVLSEGQADKLRGGSRPRGDAIDGVAASEALEQQAQQGWDAFRPYGTPGGIKDEILATAAAFPNSPRSS